MFGYDGKTLPFPDAHFDVVTSNQVFEHVPDLEAGLVEIAHVLKPGGRLYFTFPHQDMWREVHSNVFFVHWMTPHSRFRLAWLSLYRLLGRVRLKRKGGPRAWAAYFDRWLVDNTFYRRERDIRRAFAQAGLELSLDEAAYARFRAQTAPGRGARLLSALPAGLARGLTRRLAGLAGSARRLPEG